jgi:Tol biopolymer transport system component
VFVAFAVMIATVAQPPSPGMSPDEVARLESRHLTNIRQVTYGFAKAGEGYFSPDGQRIIFQATPALPESIFHSPRPNEDGYQMFVADLKPDAVPKMVSTGKGRCTCGYFSSDGKTILFGSSHLDPDVDKPVAPRGPSYSRTARYNWEFPEWMEIFTANADGSNLTRLTNAPGYDAEGSYSADGKHIVFTSFRDGDPEIYIMNADGTNPRRVTSKPGYDGGPFFSPDGKRIIYRSDRKNNDMLQIYVNSVAGDAEKALTDNDAVNWCPFWYPDSRHIIYATSRHGHGNYELYLMDVDTGSEERITYAEGFDGLPVFSADGKKMMWTSKGRPADKTSQLFIADFSLEPREPSGPAPAPVTATGAATSGR